MSALQTLGRRGFLGRLVALPIAVPAVVTMPSGSDTAEAEIATGLTTMVGLFDRVSDFCDDLLDRQAEFKTMRPPRPKELYERFLMRVSFERAFEIGPNGRQRAFISPASIEKMRTDPRGGTGLVISDGEDLIGHHTDYEPKTASAKRQWKRENEKVRDAAAEIVAVYDAWMAECDALAERIGLTAAQKAYDEASDEYRQEICRLLEIPVATLQGFALRARLIREYDLDDDAHELVAELAALAPVTSKEDVNV
jgi:hypothetical protein